MSFSLHPIARWAALVATLLAPAGAQAGPSRLSRPSASPYGVLSTEPSRVLPKWTPAVGLSTDYGNGLTRSGAPPRIDDRTTTHLLLGFGLFGWVELDADLPIVVQQRATISDVRGPAPPHALGDLRLGLKGTVLRAPRRGFGLGLGIDATAPTGDPSALTGASRPTVAPAVLLEQRIAAGIVALANVGYLERPGRVDGDAITYRTAILLPLAARIPVGIIAELDGAIALDKAGSNPISLRAGVRWQSRAGVVMQVFAGGAPLGALGVARAQVGVVIGWAPVSRMRSDRAFDGAPEVNAAELAHLHHHLVQTRAAKPGAATELPANPADPDHDGIALADDRCPTVAEDVDGYDDGDGCPDLDDDNDGLRDAIDLCPGAAEIVNGYLDWDGCPDRTGPGGLGTTHESLADALDLPRPRFALGTANLERQSLEDLAVFAELLTLNPWMRGVSLTLFVHPSGDPLADRELAKARADVIVAELARLGVGPDRLSVGEARSVPEPGDAGALVRLAPRPAQPTSGLASTPVGESPAIEIEAQGPPAQRPPGATPR